MTNSKKSGDQVLTDEDVLSMGSHILTPQQADDIVDQHLQADDDGGEGKQDAKPDDTGSSGKRKITLMGREIEVDAAVALAIEGREAEFSAKLAQQGDELGRLRKQVEGDDPAKRAEIEEIDYKSLSAKWFEEPEGAMRELATKLRAQITQELTQAYNTDTASRESYQRLQEFWKLFDERNPELKAFREFNQFMLDKNMDKLGSLKIDDAIPQLAEIIKSNLKGKVGTTGKPPRQVEAGGGGPSKDGIQKPDDTKTVKPVPAKTLSDIILDRRAARRVGQSPGRAATA